MAGGIYIHIDTRDVDALYDEIKAIPALAARSARHDLVGTQMRRLLSESLTIAIENAGDFPLPYAAHLQRSLSLLSNTAVVDPTEYGVTVDIEDPELLGDWNDIQEAFYHQAIAADYEKFSVSNPIKLNIPSSYDETYASISKSGDRRAEYWEAIVRGDSTFPVTFGGANNARTVEMPIPANAEETTYLARVKFWGDRYPEWWMLENGWPGSPDIRPGNFRAIAEAKIGEFVETSFRQYVNNIIEDINAGKARISGGAVRATSGNTGRYAPYTYRQGRVA